MALYITHNDYILNTETNAQIPFDERNADYRNYLQWVAEGNTPDNPSMTTIEDPLLVDKQTIRDRIVGIVGTTDQEKEIAKNMLNNLLGIPNGN